MSISIEDQKKLHRMNLPEGYIPNPQNHRGNERDYCHIIHSNKKLTELMVKTVLDVGCFDGWLDFLLINAGFDVDGLELMPELVSAARRYADRNFIKYHIYEGEFLSVGIDKTYDAVTCFETLEHVELDVAKEYIEKMELLANKAIIISLPDQKAEDNPQHKWTPTREIIEEIFGDKKNFCLFTQRYNDKQIPMNFFISYEV